MTRPGTAARRDGASVRGQEDAERRARACVRRPRSPGVAGGKLGGSGPGACPEGAPPGSSLPSPRAAGASVTHDKAPEAGRPGWSRSVRPPAALPLQGRALLQRSARGPGTGSAAAWSGMPAAAAGASAWARVFKPPAEELRGVGEPGTGPPPRARAAGRGRRPGRRHRGWWWWGWWCRRRGGLRPARSPLVL